MFNLDRFPYLFINQEFMSWQKRFVFYSECLSQFPFFIRIISFSLPITHFCHAERFVFYSKHLNPSPLFIWIIFLFFLQITTFCHEERFCFLFLSSESVPHVIWIVLLFSLNHVLLSPGKFCFLLWTSESVPHLYFDHVVSINNCPVSFRT